MSRICWPDTSPGGGERCGLTTARGIVSLDFAHAAVDGFRSQRGVWVGLIVFVSSPCDREPP
jgi:hypothetical protein